MYKVRKAFLMAYEFHKHQKYEDDPYLVHLFDVYNVLRRYGFDDPALLAAALLHDVIEDTPASYRRVSEEVGEDVTEIVFACTDELGRNRKERKEKTLPKLVEWTKERGPGALTVKLADWVANVEACCRSDPRRLQMYQKDWPAFAELKTRFQDYDWLEPMWAYLQYMLEEYKPIGRLEL